MLFGMLNAIVGIWGTYLLRPLLSERGLGALRDRGFLVVGLLAVAFIEADTLTCWDIIFSAAALSGLAPSICSALRIEQLST